MFAQELYERITKLIKLANSSEYEGERETAKRMAAIECLDRAKPSHTVTEHETNPLKGLIEIASQENELMFSALTKIISHEAPDIFELASAMRSDAEVAVNAIKLSRILRDPNALKEEE